MSSDCANRTPDTARIKPKMVYASSREALRKSLTGISVDIQGTEKDEVSYQNSALFRSFSFFSNAHSFHVQPLTAATSPARLSEESGGTTTVFTFSRPLFVILYSVLYRNTAFHPPLQSTISR
jgi:hypothetical protein